MRVGVVCVVLRATHIHEQVRRGSLAAHGWRRRMSTHSRALGVGAGGAGGLRPRLPRSPPHHSAPTATVLISHYNLRAARFLPLLLPRFVLRIIECIPLAPPPCEPAPPR